MAKRRKYTRSKSIRRTGPRSSKRSYSSASTATRRRRKKTRTYTKKKKINIFGFEKLSPEISRGILVVFLLIFSVISILSIIDLAGTFGEFWGEFIRRIFGWQAYILPIFIFSLAIAVVIGQKKFKKFEVKTSNYFGVFLFVVCISGIMHLFFDAENALEIVEEGTGGGYLGFASSYPLRMLMGVWGSGAILGALGAVGFILSYNITLQDMVEFMSKIKRLASTIISRINRNAFPEEEGRQIEQQEKIKVSNFDGTTKTINAAGRKFGSTKDVAGENGPEELQVKSIADFDDKDDEIKMPIISKETDWDPYPLDLLDSKSSTPTSGDIEANAKQIKQTLHNFGIEVEMAEVNIGPTVTQYTFKPAEGIKLTRITALNNDLALALAAHPIRIEAPIPGRSLVGIELPNKAAAMVRLRDILESRDFQKRKNNLSIALGRNVAGQAVVENLAKMPHLMIGGATGSGKSICLNTLLLTLLWQNSPADMKMILVDPKKVEMTAYNDIPHLLTPVITDVKKIINSLRWAVAEMDRRFELFSKAGSRDIISYNSSAKNEKVPYIIIIIDELADLMAVAANEVEACIVRLAQMARAVGIHLILATQRPSVNVITGLIKANITSRIAFAVASQIDSRTIIDTAGAEKLLGNGDMLFVTSDLGKPRRIQGAFVSEEEIKKVTNHLKKQGDPAYEENVVEKQTGASNIPGIPGSDDDADDDLYGEAREVVIAAQKASASLLQRRLRVGYARAARLIDILEEKGIVGPADGAKPREILVGNEQQVDQAVEPDEIGEEENYEEEQEQV